METGLVVRDTRACTEFVLAVCAAYLNLLRWLRVPRLYVALRDPSDARRAV
jgi:hypothetical protein